MRKASKKTIAANMKAFGEWLPRILERIDKIDKGGALAVKGMIADVRGRIEAGDCGICTQALIRSCVRVVEDFESGFYIGVTEITDSGVGFRCAY